MAQSLSGSASKKSFNWSGLASGLFDFGSSIIGAVGSAKAAKKAYKYQRQLMNHQFNLTRQLNQNAYQDTTYSMRQAGINPMLAITQGVNGLSAGSGGSVNVQNPVEAGINTAAARSAIKNERMLAESSYENAMSSAYNLNAQEDFTRDQNAAFNEFNPQIQKENIKQMKAQTANIEANTADAYNQIKNRDRLTTSQIGLNSNSSRGLRIESDFNEEHPVLYGISRAGAGIAALGGAGIAGYSAIRKPKSSLHR